MPLEISVKMMVYLEGEHRFGVSCFVDFCCHWTLQQFLVLQWNTLEIYNWLSYLLAFVRLFLWDMKVRVLCKKMGWKGNLNWWVIRRKMTAHVFWSRLLIKPNKGNLFTYCNQVPCAQKSVYLSWFWKKDNLHLTMQDFNWFFFVCFAKMLIRCNRLVLYTTQLNKNYS